ncbi:MAG: retroviral-like aspartic protease family protein [Leptolyngbya sp. SIO1E4]|nr:retroviral-like aspartic protease family protein [Leptolyngbya sp. SIO1E4]
MLETTPDDQPAAQAEAAETEAAETEETTDTDATDNAEAAQESETAEALASPQRDFFREAVNRAQSAVAIGQSAQSQDDWTLAESRWKQAVLLMQQVPTSDPNHTTAQQKVQEYQQNASQAARRASGEVAPAGATVANTSRPDGLVAQIPIVNRMGGTPVVSVTLTGNSTTQQFRMLFDTGATFTLITPAMAREIGVLIVDEATVTVADGRRVQMPIGYVDTLEVGGLVVRDLLVGIGGDVALLGQDVYGPYGISAGGSSINLYE